MYEAWFFMVQMTKFQKMPLLLLPMSQKCGGNSGNFPNCNQIICVAVPNEGNRQNFNNGQSICQYFSNLFGIFGNFPNVLTCSSQY